MKYFLITAFFAMLIAENNHAQTINAPCARILQGLGQDSVLWSAVPCSNFDGYVIYGQANGSGTFTRLDTITTPNQLAFVNSNPQAQLWNYRIGLLCGGIEIGTTTVVSNQRPITPNIRSVSIIGNVPVLTWDASPSPEVIGYQVYKENPYGSGNYFPYPTPNSIVSGTQFVDATATNLQVRYAILAVTPCNKSLLGEGNPIDGTTGPHTSILLNGSLDSCSQTVSLSWNEYQHWLEGVQQYEIWLSINGNPAQPVDTVHSLSYQYPNAQDEDSLVFYVRAVELNRGGNSAVTNQYTLNVRANRPMDFIYLTNVTVNPNNEVELSWQWDTDVDYKSGTILRDGANLSPLAAPTALNQTFTDNLADVQTTSYPYRIQTTDLCGLQANSNIGHNLLLKGEAKDGFVNLLRWSPFSLQYAEVVDYEIHRIVGSNTQRLATIPNTDTFYNDHVSVYHQAEYSCCYYIVANSKITLPNGRIQYIQSRSNTHCVVQQSIVYMPNAFAPDGKNTTFKPYIVFDQSIQNYSMLIFDRNGGQVFESNDPHIGWNGTKNGDGLPQGIYVYQIRFHQADGKRFEKRGTLMLIR